MRGRRYVGQIKLGNLSDRLEDGVQLLGKAIDLLFAQRQPRKLGDVKNLLARDGNAPILPVATPLCPKRPRTGSRETM